MKDSMNCSTGEKPHRLQVLNALHMGWVEYCAALRTAKRMAGDMDWHTLRQLPHPYDLKHAGAECAAHGLGGVLRRFEDGAAHGG